MNVNEGKREQFSGCDRFKWSEIPGKKGLEFPDFIFFQCWKIGDAESFVF